MSVAVLIVAAGRGLRAGGDVPKQWRDLNGQPVVTRTVAGALAALPAARIVTVIHPDDRARAAALDGSTLLCDGGATRSASVRAGLDLLAADPPGIVLIHDAARPLASPALYARVVAALDRHPGAAPALPVTDALWRGDGGIVTGTQDREGLFRAQTPQGFRFAEILAAYRAFPGDVADDVAVARAAGLAVAIVPGDDDNLKITMPGDFARAAQLLGG